VKPLVLFLLFATALSAHAQPARVILIRHAEKPVDADDPNLSAEGRTHAQQLIFWFSEGKLYANSPPAALYAPEPGDRGGGVRCIQTLEPAARHFDLRIRTPHRADEYRNLAKHILRENSLQGKTAVVCWSHTELPALASALGVQPEPPRWKDKDYASAYVITYGNGNARLERVKQKLKKKTAKG
jgi:hypothetical protein